MITGMQGKKTMGRHFARLELGIDGSCCLRLEMIVTVCFQEMGSSWWPLIVEKMGRDPNFGVLGMYEPLLNMTQGCWGAGVWETHRPFVLD